MKSKGGRFLVLILLLSGFFYCLNLNASVLVNINTAELEELDTLPGIGSTKAQAIIDYRNENEDFLAIEDIMLVSGVGEVTYENIKDLITVDEIINKEPETGAEEYGGKVVEDLEETNDNLSEENEADLSAGYKKEELSAPESENFDYKLGDIVINELVSDPADGEVEWVELFCNLGEKISLTDWHIKEGSESKTNLTDEIDDFFVIEKPKGNLNNKGDIVELYYKDILIDRVIYGNWNGGGNAPVAGDPFSVARKINGYTTFNNKNDFSVTVKPTKNSGNIIINEPSSAEAMADKTVGKDGDRAKEISAAEKENYNCGAEILISEIFPNPKGSDTENEFIEFYNSSSKDTDLAGWTIGDESKKRYEIKADREAGSLIKAGEYFVVSRSESKIALNNTGDTVKLFCSLEDNPIAELIYKKSKENQSYNLDLETGEYAWNEYLSPGGKNNIKKINYPPLVDFYCPEKIALAKPVVFDSSDTIDEDGDTLEYFWDFGDGFTNTLANPEHTFFKTGAYTIKLTVRDLENEVVKEKIIISGKLIAEEDDNSAAKTDIIINEVMPAPLGADSEEEFIEIYNYGASKINLLNWQVDDIDGGSKPYSFSEEFILEAGKYFVLERAESKVALNNTGDTVRLLSQEGGLIDSVDYAKAISGEAYARGQNNKWFWTTNPTPGKENIIKVNDSQVVLAEASKVLGITNVKMENEIKKVSLEEIKDLEIGDKIITKGVVAVLPGVLGSQFFYIVGSPGIQVYSYKKEFPDLKVGDYIEVNGEISEVSGEKRLKTKSLEDFKILEHIGEPKPKQEMCEKITENNIGELIAVSGEVVERKSSTVYLDDGTEEIKIYIKSATGINASEIKAGANLAISGILSKTSSGLRLLPRFNDDIVRKDIESEEHAQVFGEVSATSEWELAKRDKKLELFKYLLIIAGFLIIALIGLLIKIRKK
ncbi:lamin tail domain-containing protein [Candidatus Parcubacteria bacterium]|nr:lamin tail domain-containing protein [Candidatus Parcubacteria bacterium]